MGGGNIDKEPIFTKNFCLMFGAIFCTSFVLYLLVSTAAESALAFGATVTIAGLVTGIYIFGAMISRFYAGCAMAQYGWLKTAVPFMVLHAVCCIGYFFAGDVTTFLIVRFIHGIGFGASSSAVITIGMSCLPKSRYFEAGGYLLLGQTLSIAVGPLAAGILYSRWGGPACFTAAFIASAAALVLTLLADLDGIDPKGRTVCSESKVSGISRFIEMKAVPLSICGFLCGAGYTAILSFHRVYGAETDLLNAFTCFFLIYAGVLLISRPLAGRYQDKYGDNVVCCPGIILQAAGVCIMALYPSALTVCLCAVCCALGYGTISSACNAIVNRIVEPERRPYATSVFWVFCDLMAGVGPAFLGASASAYGYTGMFVISAIVTFIALPVYILVWGRSGGRQKRAPIQYVLGK